MFLRLKLFDDIRRYYVKCIQTAEETDVQYCTLRKLDYKIYKRTGSVDFENIEKKI